MWKKLTLGSTYFDQFILSMSSLQTTHHNMCAAYGVKSPHFETHEVLEKEFESNPQVKPMHIKRKAVYAYSWCYVFVY